MKPGQVLTQWWQHYVEGRLRTPQDIAAATLREIADNTEDRFTQEPVDSGRWDAPKRLSAPHFLTSELYARQGMRADWQQVDHRLRLLAAKVCLRAKALGIPLYIHSAFRTREEQDILLQRGVTKVGYPRSAHNIGEAFDLVHGVYHWDLTQQEWLFIRHIVQDELRKMNANLPKFKRLHLNWGGDDGTPQDTFRWDPAHWEIADYRDRIRAVPERVPVYMAPAVIVQRYR